MHGTASMAQGEACPQVAALAAATRPQVGTHLVAQSSTLSDGSSVSRAATARPAARSQPGTHELLLLPGWLPEGSCEGEPHLRRKQTTKQQSGN